ncbi:MAG TPA: hypothetical protein VMT90_10470 [Dehalococcoidia bacterium]|jgi:hypothetical protein|nr:hypothetical protein [Dehalococcoidia bacterium]
MQFVMCADTSTANDESGADAWPMDMNDDQRANVLDVSVYSPWFNKVVGPPDYAPQRIDLNEDGQINVLDVSKYSPVFNHRCTEPLAQAPVGSSSRYLSNPEYCFSGPGFPCAMRQLGTAIGDMHHQDDLVILDFGRPWYEAGQWGAHLLGHDPPVFETIGDVELAIRDFLRGYADSYNAYHVQEQHITVVVGTNNCVDSLDCPAQPFGSGYTNGGHAQAWADMISDLNDWVDVPPSYRAFETVWAGSDIEPNWSSFGPAVDWVGGYNFKYLQWPYDRRWRFVNYGSADGCPSSSIGSCDNGWTQGNIRYVSYTIDSAWPLPDIYRMDGMNAGQWQEISKTQGLMHFIGSVSQYTACMQKDGPECVGADAYPDNSWHQLWVLLNGDISTASNPDWSTDIGWDN